MQRRTFVKLMAGSAIGTGISLPLFSSTIQGQRDKWGALMPLKNFGRTGRKVTILGVGGFHVGRMSDYEAQKTIELAIGEGIRFFDAAESYVGGENEVKYGKFLTPKYREEIFLLTKTKARDGSGATEHLNASLKRMQTDYVDLWLMHQVDSKEDFDVLRSRGMLDAFIKAKESGKVKHIGFSGHRSPEASLYVFEQTGLTMEANMLPVNVLDPSYSSFIKNVIPVLHEKKMGIIAMKTLAGGAFWGGGFEGGRGMQSKVIDQISVKDAIHFALSMPVDVLVTGAKDAEMLQEKIDLTKNFVQLNQKQQESLIARVSGFAGTEIEYYKA